MLVLLPRVIPHHPRAKNLHLDFVWTALSTETICPIYSDARTATFGISFRFSSVPHGQDRIFFAPPARCPHSIPQPPPLALVEFYFVRTLRRRLAALLSVFVRIFFSL
jgi:hypothetical protein